MKLKSLLPLALAGSLVGTPTTTSAMNKQPKSSHTTGTISKKSKDTPRGIENNNPGNIKKSSSVWQGSIGDDGTFVKFRTPEDGIRALSVMLKVYKSKGIDTLKEIISKLAPSTENVTSKYINFVSKKLNKLPEDKIDVSNREELMKFLKAIIEYENGIMPYTDAVIFRAIDKS